MQIGAPLFRAALILLVAAFAACGRMPAPVGVQGVVTLDAQPIPEGRIEFEPLPGSPAQHRDAEIRNGQFVLPDAEGLFPGQEFRVVIKAFRKTGRTHAPGEMGIAYEETEQYLPAQYNSATTLRVTITPGKNYDDLRFDLVSSGT